MQYFDTEQLPKVKSCLTAKKKKKKKKKKKNRFCTGAVATNIAIDRWFAISNYAIL
jgi:hypothetical protein